MSHPIHFHTVWAVDVASARTLVPHKVLENDIERAIESLIPWTQPVFVEYEMKFHSQQIYFNKKHTITKFPLNYFTACPS